MLKIMCIVILNPHILKILQINIYQYCIFFDATIKNMMLLTFLHKISIFTLLNSNTFEEKI